MQWSQDVRMALAIVAYVTLAGAGAAALERLRNRRLEYCTCAVWKTTTSPCISISIVICQSQSTKTSQTTDYTDKWKKQCFRMEFHCYVIAVLLCSNAMFWVMPFLCSIFSNPPWHLRFLSHIWCKKPWKTLKEKHRCKTLCSTMWLNPVLVGASRCFRSGGFTVSYLARNKAHTRRDCRKTHMQHKRRPRASCSPRQPRSAAVQRLKHKTNGKSCSFTGTETMKY